MKGIGNTNINNTIIIIFYVPMIVFIHEIKNDKRSNNLVRNKKLKSLTPIIY